ncbi:MAG: cystine ABC transporter substrate-binding protein [Campylobacteraceae bacterium]|jgi:cystine transport system substrate-binding protein|nr:cystine ABC transporter substrate-binding protein [Campylobacteraceae bacterium]
MIHKRIFKRIFSAALGLSLVAVFSVNLKAADNSLQNIKKAGEIVVGLEGTYPPFSFQNEKGELTGFEVEFAKALAKELGVKAKIAPAKFDGLLASLESRRVDVVINQITISEERKKKYNFSTPYTYSGIQVLTKKENAGTVKESNDLVGKKVGVGLGSNYEDWLRDNIKGVDIRTYDDDPTKYNDLNVGRIDAILIDRIAAIDLVKKTKNRLSLAGEPFSKQEAGVAIRKSDVELLTAVNRAIATLKANGELGKLSIKWFEIDITK